MKLIHCVALAALGAALPLTSLNEAYKIRVALLGHIECLGYGDCKLSTLVSHLTFIRCDENRC